MMTGGGIDWSKFEDDKLEMILLGIWYRTRHSQGYRRAPDERTRDVDHVTGAPLSEANLLPIGHAQWISGIDLALQAPIFPDGLATACLGLYWKPRMINLSPEEKAREEELLKRPEITPEEFAALAPKPRANWTRDEVRSHAEMVYRWKKLLMRFEALGWVVVKPPVVWSQEFASGYGRDGMPRVAHATYKGLDEAEQRIPGTRYAKGAYSALAVAPDHVLAHAHGSVPWALRMAKEEVAGA